MNCSIYNNLVWAHNTLKFILKDHTHHETFAGDIGLVRSKGIWCDKRRAQMILDFMDRSAWYSLKMMGIGKHPAGQYLGERKEDFGLTGR